MGSSIPILQGGSGSQGDWITGTEYPIIGPNGQGAIVDGYYTTPGVPTLYLHCGSVLLKYLLVIIGGHYLLLLKEVVPLHYFLRKFDLTLLKHDGVMVVLMVILLKLIYIMF